MRSVSIQSIVSAVVIGLGAVLVSLGLLGMTSPTAAHAQSTSDGIFVFHASFPESSVEIRDLSGNVLGEELHGGTVLCNANNCGQATLIPKYPCSILSDPSCGVANIAADTGIVYRFQSWQSLDLSDAGSGTVVVAGTGTISSHGEKVRFSFTATFQDNRDGTVSVTYVASRPEASFIIPRAPGSFVIYRRR
jgi:hypothetical protein